MQQCCAAFLVGVSLCHAHMIACISLLLFGHAYQKQSFIANSSNAHHTGCHKEVVLYTRAKEGRYLHAIAALVPATTTLLFLAPLLSACAALRYACVLCCAVL